MVLTDLAGHFAPSVTAESPDPQHVSLGNVAGVN
jgi:hypothetical protein